MRENMRFIIIVAASMISMFFFSVLAKAAFEIFTLPSAILFNLCVGTIAISMVRGIILFFRKLDRREFMKEFQSTSY
jgi:hypothetical protein